MWRHLLSCAHSQHPQCVNIFESLSEVKKNVYRNVFRKISEKLVAVIQDCVSVLNVYFVNKPDFNNVGSFTF